MKGGDFWVTGEGEQPLAPKAKKRSRRRRIEYRGWGSRPLIEFLEGIGQETSTQRSQHEVVGMINKYIEDKGLACPKMKRKINCDDVLFAIFRRKTILRARVHNLLEEHYADNRDSSDDWSSDSSGEDGEKPKKKKKKDVSKMVNKAPEKPRSCFAAVVAENINLVYLRKSLVEELRVKDPESFDSKLVGSFVRMKCDPNDISQKMPFQLQLVTGIERANGHEILLKVSNYFEDVPINMLSDANFEEGEVENVRERVKDGLLKKLLLIEVEAKAQMLHRDITKHSIAKELNLLKNRIEHANIKGWRKQLWELRDRKKKLETPSEVEKMLNTMPEVMAEELKVDDAAIIGSGDIPTSPRVNSDDSHAEEVEDAADDSTSPVENHRGFGDIFTTVQHNFDGSRALDVEGAAAECASPVQNQHGSGDILASPRVCFDDSRGQEVEDDASDSTLPVENNHGSGYILASPRVSFDDSPAQKVEDAASDSTSPVENNHGSGDILTSPRVIIDDSPAQKVEDAAAAADSTSPVENQHADAQIVDLEKEVNHEKPAKDVIDLTSDDDESQPPPQPSLECATSEWHYKDPWGSVRGPFTLNALKRWSDAKYFPSHFRIWKTGEALGDGVLLLDVLRRAFPS